MITSPRLWQELAQNRIIYVGGVFGSGKTLLSAAFAEHFHKLKYSIIANFPLLWNSDITPDMLSGMRKTVVILDESGARLLDARKWNSKDSGALLETMDYCRKQDVYFILPSATIVDKRARRLSIVRNLRAHRFMQSIGLDWAAWHYYGVPVQDEQFAFMLWFPYAYFNTYSTGAIPGAYEDALSILLRRFQARVEVDMEASKRISAQLERHLEDGGSIPGLRVWDRGEEVH